MENAVLITCTVLAFDPFDQHRAPSSLSLINAQFNAFTGMGENFSIDVEIILPASGMRFLVNTSLLIK